MAEEWSGPKSTAETESWTLLRTVALWAQASLPPAGLSPAATMAAPPLVLVLDGEIGAGKTTLLELLGREFASRGHPVAVVAEPVDRWKRVGILQDFYGGGTETERARTAYAFQTFVFVTRVEEALRVAEATPAAEIVLLERSIFTDRHVFVELMREVLGAQQVEMYLAWWHLWARVMPYRPGVFIYLKPSLDLCMDRVEARAREGEVDGDGKASGGAAAQGGVSVEYQARLRRAHEAYLQQQHLDEFPGMPLPPPDRDVLVLEGALADDDFARDPAAARRILKAVFDHLGIDFDGENARMDGDGARMSPDGSREGP